MSNRTVIAIGAHERRERMFSVIAWISILGFAFLIPTYMVIMYYTPQFPGFALILTNILGIVLSSGSLWLLRRGRFSRALLLYMLATHAAFAAALYVLDGVFSPLMMCFPILTIFAALLGGRRAAMFSVLGALVTALGLSVLDLYGGLPSLNLQGMTAYLLANVIFLATLVTVNVLLNQFEQTNEYALNQVQAHRDELTEAIQRAEALAETERESSQREAELGRGLREVVREYTQFLQQVTEGNYRVRLEVDRLAEGREAPPELLELGRYLNATVESLVLAVTDMEAAQRMYTSRSWEAYTETGTVSRGYRYQMLADGQTQVESDNRAWLEVMRTAVRDHGLTIQQMDMAAPLNMRGQIIGAIGARRVEGREWSEDEQVLINAITDQLAQTIDNLRLLEDTGRRAARERAASDVAGRIRAEVEIEAVLERALAELGRVLRAERGAAHLSLGQQQED